jgi:tetratricopeptide (TPR) repeat protein
VVDSYENLILLCRIDHKKVDDQRRHYTTARLRQVKAEHEAWVEHTLEALPGQTNQIHLPAPEPSAETVVVRVAGTRMAVPELFVGRTRELRSLLSSLAPGRHTSARQSKEPGAVVVSAVAGMGGIGKTTLAQHAASVAVDRGWFPGGTVMVNLRGYDPSDRRIRPGQVFSPLLFALGMPPQRIPATTLEQATAYHQYLADLADQKRPVLLVLDNASSTEQVLDLLPRQAVHRALVTTRDTLTLPSTRRVELDVLTRRESLALLRQAVRHHHPHDTRVDGDRAASERLIQVCGRLPLAVGIAAALLVDDPELTIAALANDLADTATRLAVLQHGGTAVAGVIEVSWRLLQEHDPDAARLLRLLTLDLGPDISTAAAAALADAPQHLVAAQLRRLRQAHLLHTTSGRWRMHDLVRVHIHATHAEGDDHHAAVTRLLGYYLATATAAGDYFRPPSKRTAQAVFTNRLDAVTWLDTHQATLAAAVALATTIARYTIAVDLAVESCAHLEQRRDRAEDALVMARDAGTAATALGEPSYQAKALNLLGIVLWLTNRLAEAESSFRQALALWQDIGDANREGKAWSNIGICLWGMQRLGEAVTAHRQALTLYRKDDDREQEARVSINLAVTLRDMKRFDEAINQCRHAIGLCQHSGDRDREGRAHLALATALRRREQWDEAIEAYRCAQVAFRDVDNRDFEGQAWYDVAKTLREAGRSQAAIDPYHRAIAAFQDGHNRQSEAAVWHGLGLLHEEARLDEAIEAYSRAQALWRDVGDRDSEAIAWYNRGRALRRAGRVKAAIAAYHRALELNQQIGDRTSESQTWKALSVALSHDNREAEAQHARRQAEAVLAQTTASKSTEAHD